MREIESLLYLFMTIIVNLIIITKTILRDIDNIKVKYLSK